MGKSDEEEQRLDIRLLNEFKLPSRSAAQSLIKSEHVKVNGRLVTRSSYSVTHEDHISVDRSSLEQKPNQLELEIIYEDEDCVVINKPEGILTHSKGVFNPESTVASWLAAHVGLDSSTVGSRNGIVHRLDRGTSGVMICAKNTLSLKWLQKQFSSRKAKKTYIALIEGEINPEAAIIDLPIERNPNKPQRFRVGANGKTAQTEYKTEQFIEVSEHLFSLLKLTPKTGRTHQLRVHLAYMEHPIVGDVFYGGLKAGRLYLHALSLELVIPNGKKMTFNAGLPDEFKNPEVEWTR